MIDLVICGIVLYILYQVYNVYGFIVLWASYAIWRAIVNIVPRLFGLEPMRPEDAIWLVDTPGDGNGFILMGSCIIERAPAEFCNSAFKRNSITRRFRQIPTYFLGKPCWKIDPNYNFKNHNTVYSQPVWTKQELQVLLDDFYNKPLKRNQPPWDSLMIEHYLEDSSVFAFKFHHVFGDGMAVISNMMSYDDQKPEYYALPKKLIYTQLFQFAIAVVSIPYYLIKGMLRPDYKFLLHGPVSSSWRLTDFSSPIPLLPIKLYCRQKGMKLNNYILSALGESIRRYTEKYDKAPPGINLSLPISLRGYPEDGSKLEMHNDTSTLIWSLALIANREKRQQEINLMLESMKASPEVLVQSLLVKLSVGHLPHTISRQLVLQACNTVTTCCTNVPGPKNEIWCYGKKLKQLIVHSNAPGRVHMMFVCFTYNDELTISGTVDKVLADSPTEIMELFIEEINRLGKD